MESCLVEAAWCRAVTRATLAFVTQINFRLMIGERRLRAPEPKRAADTGHKHTHQLPQIHRLYCLHAHAREPESQRGVGPRGSAGLLFGQQLACCTRQVLETQISQWRRSSEAVEPQSASPAPADLLMFKSLDRRLTGPDAVQSPNCCIATAGNTADTPRRYRIMTFLMWRKEIMELVIRV
ncbi:unnamed protein product [Pleuronectes platessa]|uniref:Uncharacterized protein n=1 Tax=Pleuronectes platessa TaxID=8262 RepID=A0A9N7Z2X3_PLEPL|nr:unnamed protein product [Pleuronectes platessa]